MKHTNCFNLFFSKNRYINGEEFYNSIDLNTLNLLKTLAQLYINSGAKGFESANLDYDEFRSMYHSIAGTEFDDDLSHLLLRMKFIFITIQDGTFAGRFYLLFEISFEKDVITYVFPNPLIRLLATYDTTFFI